MAASSSTMSTVGAGIGPSVPPAPRAERPARRSRVPRGPDGPVRSSSEVSNVLLLVASLLVILAGCELFVNAIEWVGKRLNLDDGATGSLLAAVGTAMPETLIPIIAIVFVGDEDAKEVGIGAIMGAPFLLATLAMAVTAAAIVGFSATGR